MSEYHIHFTYIPVGHKRNQPREIRDVLWLKSTYLPDIKDAIQKVWTTDERGLIDVISTRKYTP